MRLQHLNLHELCSTISAQKRLVHELRQIQIPVKKSLAFLAADRVPFAVCHFDVLGKVLLAGVQLAALFALGQVSFDVRCVHVVLAVVALAALESRAHLQPGEAALNYVGSGGRLVSKLAAAVRAVVFSGLLL